MPLKLAITLASTIDVNTDLTIDGPGAANLVVSGGNAVEAFNIALGVTATISGITLENGNAGTGNGGAIYNSGTLTITGSTLSGNIASSGQGGAIFINGSPTLTVTNSTLSSNSAVSGGALADGTISITDSTLSDNVATGNGEDGGAIFAGTLTVTDSTLLATPRTLMAERFSTTSKRQPSLIAPCRATMRVTEVVSTTMSARWISTTARWQETLRGGGGIYRAGGTLAWELPLLANSGSGEDCQTYPGLGGIFTDSGYNLDDDGSCGFTASSDLSDAPLG